MAEYGCIQFPVPESRAWEGSEIVVVATVLYYTSCSSYYNGYSMPKTVFATHGSACIEFMNRIICGRILDAAVLFIAAQ